MFYFMKKGDKSVGKVKKNEKDKLKKESKSEKQLLTSTATNKKNDAGIGKVSENRPRSQDGSTVARSTGRAGLRNTRSKSPATGNDQTNTALQQKQPVVTNLDNEPDSHDDDIGNRAASSSGCVRNCSASSLELVPPPDRDLHAGESLGDDYFLEFHQNTLEIPLHEVIKRAELLDERELCVSRQSTGDFGFCLRRSVIMDCLHATSADVASKECLFAEPKTEFLFDNPTGLCIGDRLMKVNNTEITNMTREEVADLIRTSGESVKLTVKLVPELKELMKSLKTDNPGACSLASSSSCRRVPGTDSIQTNCELVNDVLISEDVWLMHRNGYAKASLIESKSPEDISKAFVKTVKIQLHDTGEMLEVPEEYLAKVNPSFSDDAENLVDLVHINEAAVLHVLRQRFASKLIHTFASSLLLIMNPMKQLSLYSEKVMQFFKNCVRNSLPPHVYAVAQSAYREMLTSREDQSVVMMGRSGSGKTFNSNHVLYYLCYAAGSSNKVVTVEKLRAVSTLLEFFGQCRTVLNMSASCSTVLYSVNFDQCGQIANVSLQTFMVDKGKIAQTGDLQSTFKIFYLLLLGIHDEKLKKELYLDGSLQPSSFIDTQFNNMDVQHVDVNWAKVQGSLDMLGVQEEEAKAIWSVVAAIHHLGVAGITAGVGGKVQFLNPQSAQRSALLLGVTLDDLSRYIFQNESVAVISSCGASCEVDVGDGLLETSRKLLIGLASGLYVDVYNALIYLINRALSSSSKSVCSIYVLDTPGFQNPASCGCDSGASFQDFFCNYVQERINLLYSENTFVSKREKLQHENVGCCEFDEVCDLDFSATVRCIDKPACDGSTQVDWTVIEDKGLLWLLDKQSHSRASGDDISAFLDSVFAKRASTVSKCGVLLRRVKPSHFELPHMLGTNHVVYSCHDWHKDCRENENIRSSVFLLRDSQKDNICNLFLKCRGSSSVSFIGTYFGVDKNVRRTSSIRRDSATTDIGNLKRKSLIFQLISQVDCIVDTLQRTKLHFVQCLLPDHDAAARSTLDMNESNLNIKLLRSQIRGSLLVENVRMNKQGFPDEMGYASFVRNFQLLLSHVKRSSLSTAFDLKQTTKEIMTEMDVDCNQYKLGNNLRYSLKWKLADLHRLKRFTFFPSLNKIFMRLGTVSNLKAQRDEKLHDIVVKFQAFCRGCFARKCLNKRKIEYRAITCIQRNIRKFMAIQNWSWWRLYCKVLPLLNVHCTEERLRSTIDDLEACKSKLNKVTRDRDDLEKENQKLKLKVEELSADFICERDAAERIRELNHLESAERKRFENNFLELQNSYEDLQKRHECLENEALNMKMLHSDQLSDDSYSGDLFYKQKCDILHRELENTKRTMQQKFDEHVERHYLIKKSLDKKLACATDETDRLNKDISQWKRKAQHLTQEANDMKYMLEQQIARNTVLEKKQKKVDGDISVLQEEVKQERLKKERTLTLCDQHVAEKFKLEKDIQELKFELEAKDEKISAIEQELNNITSDKKGENDSLRLLRLSHDLELKVKDQEEELDEMAGQMQLLEQSKLQLEMNLENMKKEYQKELLKKDEELEEMRSNFQKRIKYMEDQLELEHDDRQRIVREKHEIERKLYELEDQSVGSSSLQTVKRMKKELRYTKALLNDAYTMLEHNTDEGSYKSAIRQLQNQLEDAEMAKAAALKAKQLAVEDLQDVSMELEETSKLLKEIQAKNIAMGRECSELHLRVEESDDEMEEILRKYRAAVSQVSANQQQLSTLAVQVSELEGERNTLKEQLLNITTKFNQLDGETTSSHEQLVLTLKTKDLENKLELETATRCHLEVQLKRLQESLKNGNEDRDSLRQQLQQSHDEHRRLHQLNSELKETSDAWQQKESDFTKKYHEMEVALEDAGAENNMMKNDLKLALKRIEGLQAAINDTVDTDFTESDTESDSG